MQKRFTQFAANTSSVMGTPKAFLAAVIVIVVWAVTGPVFRYSDTWQLVINTGTTIVTFLMVFLIQNTQNRDATAIHLKLDELLKAMEGAENRLISAENLQQDELDRLRDRFTEIARQGGKEAIESDVADFLEEATVKVEDVADEKILEIHEAAGSVAGRTDDPPDASS